WCMHSRSTIEGAAVSRDGRWPTFRTCDHPLLQRPPLPGVEECNRTRWTKASSTRSPTRREPTDEARSAADAERRRYSRPYSSDAAVPAPLRPTHFNRKVTQKPTRGAPTSRPLETEPLYEHDRRSCSPRHGVHVTQQVHTMSKQDTS